MKVFIVLVLLVAFIGFGESKDLVQGMKCDYCHKGAEYTRKNIKMDYKVI
jgi:hypothetical protein